jgi:hypothetical protein
VNLAVSKKHALIIVVLTIDQSPVVDFFPFGTKFNDTIGPRAVDAASEAIPLISPIIYYMKEQMNFFVSIMWCVM